MKVPEVRFDHLYRLSDDAGLFEHAEFTVPRQAHGYCVDDVARGLLIVARQPQPTPRLAALAATYLRFVLAAQAPDGRFANRRGIDLQWEDEPTVEDCWGRAVWGLGTVVARMPDLAAPALASFDRAVQQRSPFSRSTAFAALGAAEVLRARPGHTGARDLLIDAVVTIGRPGDSPNWRWPEPRLRYGNASLAEALIAAGDVLDAPRALADGLAMLGWLLDVETAPEGHVSVVPVDGWSLGEPRPGYDQQPIEVAALADACALAFEVTGELRWLEAVRRCAAWFLGANDVAVALLDPVSGGGCDGLHLFGRNENQGAESTLALISTLQQAQRLPAPMGARAVA